MLVLAAAALVLVACDRQSASTPTNLPADDPAHGIYNYDHAKALGIRVPTVRPRLALVIVGYPVEAVAEADSPYEKGRLVCSASGTGGWFFRMPLIRSGDFDREEVLRTKLQRAYGVERTDDPVDLLRGCADTDAGRAFLAQ